MDRSTSSFSAPERRDCAKKFLDNHRHKPNWTVQRQPRRRLRDELHVRVANRRALHTGRTDARPLSPTPLFRSALSGELSNGHEDENDGSEDAQGNQDLADHTAVHDGLGH